MFNPTNDEMNDELAESLFKAGILQFGLFGETTKQQMTRLELLPSYPALMQRCARRMVRLVNAEINRLICMSENAALAAIVSLESGLPLIIGERNEAGDIRFLGAYDIEHPSAFIGTRSGALDQTARLDIQRRAERVGLQVIQWIWVLDDAQNGDGVALMTINDAVERLVARRILPFRPI